MDPKIELITDLLPPERIKFLEPMSKHTTFKIGGPADALVTPETEEELSQVVSFCRGKLIPILVIGQGSNLLVRDGGFRGVVVRIDRPLGRVEFSGTRVSAGAGIPLVELSRLAGERSLGGLEFAAGIPGSLGGAVVMNAGAYDGEMKEVVTSVRVMDETGSIEEWEASRLDYGYRHSSLQGSGLVVVSADLQLRNGEKSDILAKMEEFNERRSSRQPLDMPSAGSVFRRPPGKFVGPMIEELGLKGYSVGDAQVSEKHAGFIVNRGQARAKEVLELIGVIQQVVQERYDIWLEPEIRVVGEDQTDKQAVKDFLIARGPIL